MTSCLLPTRRWHRHISVESESDGVHCSTSSSDCVFALTRLRSLSATQKPLLVMDEVGQALTQVLASSLPGSSYFAVHEGIAVQQMGCRSQQALAAAAGSQHHIVKQLRHLVLKVFPPSCAPSSPMWRTCAVESGQGGASILVRVFWASKLLRQRPRASLSDTDTAGQRLCLEP